MEAISCHWWRKLASKLILCCLLCSPLNAQLLLATVQFNYDVTYNMHYLDDFLTLGAPYTSECSQNLAIIKWLFNILNIPIQGWASKLKHRAKVVKEHSIVEPMPIHSTDDHPPSPKIFHMKHFMGTANLLNSG